MSFNSLAFHKFLQTSLLVRLSRPDMRWLSQDILFPWFISRIALTLTGWFAASFAKNPYYPIQEAIARGWHFSPYRLLDIWGRWDTGWYFSIIQDGYYLNGDIQTVQSNVAFFPLYPMLIRGILLVIPDSWETGGVILLSGVILSNLFLLIALILLHRLVFSIFSERMVARWSVIYLLAFPTGFILSSFYTESLFLMLALGAFFAASRRRWMVAGICGCLLGLTRPLGILILVPMAWIYFQDIQWNPRKIRWDVASLLLIPLGLVGFSIYIAQVTGSFLAPMQIQQAWQREFVSPLQAILNPLPFTPSVTPVAQILTVVVLVASVLALGIFPNLGYGLYGLLMIAPTLLHGTLVSNVRYYLIAFPVFVVVAKLTNHVEIRQIVAILMFTLQILYMAAWSQFFWVE